MEEEIINLSRSGYALEDIAGQLNLSETYVFEVQIYLQKDNGSIPFHLTIFKKNILFNFNLFYL